MSEVTIIEAGSPELIGHARALFREYGASIHFHLCFASFEDELAGLPGRYAPPLGRLLLAGECGNLVGCVALGPVDRVTAELKRLYVRPAARGRGIGRRLAGTAVVAARQAGYRTLRLDTLPEMAPARLLYRSLGFREVAGPATGIAPVDPQAIALELDLG